MEVKNNIQLNFPSTHKVDGKNWLDSRYVAHVLGKEHRHVLRDIRNVIKSVGEGILTHIREEQYTDSRNRRQPMYLLSERGVDSLLMNYTDEEAKRYKEVLLNELHRGRLVIGNTPSQKDIVREVLLAKQVSTATRNNLTALIKEKVENPVYWKITDDVYEYTWGLTSAKIRNKFSLPAKCNVRDYLAKHCLKAIENIENGLCNRLCFYNRKVSMCEFEELIDEEVENFITFAKKRNFEFNLELIPIEEAKEVKRINGNIKREERKRLTSGGVNNLTLFN
jgi:Rha family phage regulatory protein